MSRLSTLIAPGVAAACLALGACGEAGTTAADSSDPYSGLDQAIRTWHASIESTDEACKAKPDGKGCQGFEVACKGSREIAPGEQAQGVSAKVVVAMRWEGWDAARSEYRTSSGFAEFNKVDGAWTRSDAGPVNLSTCGEA